MCLVTRVLDVIYDAMVKYYILFVSHLIYACNFQSKTDSELERRFDPELISHLVNRNMEFFDNVVFYPNSEFSNKSFHHLGAYAIHTYKATESEILSIKKEFNLTEKLSVTHSESNCIRCPNEFDCAKAEFTTPPFKYLLDKLSLDSDFLPDEFKIFYLESKQGKYLPTSSLVMDRCEGTEWNSGYTKGLVISESSGLVTFWVTAW